jgi:hypothetical protein
MPGISPVFVEGIRIASDEPKTDLTFSGHQGASRF